MRYAVHPGHDAMCGQFSGSPRRLTSHAFLIYVFRSVFRPGNEARIGLAPCAEIGTSHVHSMAWALAPDTTENLTFRVKTRACRETMRTYWIPCVTRSNCVSNCWEICLYVHALWACQHHPYMESLPTLWYFLTHFVIVYSVFAKNIYIYIYLAVSVLYSVVIVRRIFFMGATVQTECNIRHYCPLCEYM